MLNRSKTASPDQKRFETEKNYRSLSFGLIDYRSDLFSGNNPKNTVRFYNSFDNCKQLQHWIKEGAMMGCRAFTKVKETHNSYIVTGKTFINCYRYIEYSSIDFLPLMEHRRISWMTQDQEKVWGREKMGESK